MDVKGEVNTKQQLLDELKTLRAKIADLEAHHSEHDLEEALRQSEERYSKIFEHSNDGIFVIDPERDTIIDANAKACQMLGYTRDEMMAKRVSDIHPNEMPQLQAFAQSVTKEGRGWTDELTCSTSSGRIIPSEISASTLEIDGRLYMLAIVRDITERKQTQEVQKELAVMEERNRLAREIHDSLAQGITGIIWQLNALEQAVQNGGPQPLDALNRVRDVAKECLREARRSVWDLRQSPLQGSSLVDALRNETSKASTGGQLLASLKVSGQERVLPSGVEAAILRLCQESLSNVMKHADATQVTVSLTYDDAEVRLAVQDNGKGFDTEAPRAPSAEGGGFGLVGMRERTRILGGDLAVHSHPQNGTLVEANLPLSKESWPSKT